jgi:hypothetical protein
LEEYQQQLALLRDIASAAQDAARLYQVCWDVPHCLTTIINAFFNLDRLLFPDGLAWDAKEEDDATKIRRCSTAKTRRRTAANIRRRAVAKTRLRVHHLTAENFWTKPCPKKMKKLPKDAKRAPWMRLHNAYFALLCHYDRVLADHGWGRHVAERDWSKPPAQPKRPSPFVVRLADAAELVAELSWHGAAQAECIIALGDQCYRVGDSDPVRVTYREDLILQAFLRRSPLSKSALASSSIDAEAAVTILRLLKGTSQRPPKYNGIFAPCITMAKKPRAGGYHVRIRRVD